MSGIVGGMLGLQQTGRSKAEAMLRRRGGAERGGKGAAAVFEGPWP